MSRPAPGGRRARPIGTRIFFLVGLGMIAPSAVVVWAGAAERGELERRARERDQLLASSTAERVSVALAAGLEAVNTLATQEVWSDEPGSLARLRDAVRRSHVHHHALFDAFFAFDGAGHLVAGDTEGWRLDGAAVVAEAHRLGRPAFAMSPRGEPQTALPPRERDRALGASGRDDADPALEPRAVRAAAEPSAAAPSRDDPDRRDGLDVVALVPLVGPAGEVRLVVGARVAERSPRLARLLAVSPAADGQAIDLLDGELRRVAGVGGIGGRPPLDDEDVVRALAQAQGPTGGVCRACAEGRGAAWAMAPVGPSHWSVLAWQPLAVAEAFQRRLLGQVVAATAALFLLALLFAWGATVSVTRPLRALTVAAGRIARGELSAEVGHLPGDEVGALGAALDTMRVAVREAQGRVERLNASLEARVAERTRELSTLNAALAARETERTRLLRQVISAQEDERKRIARELHDETSQQLAALSMGLDAVAQAAPEGSRAALGQLRTVAAETLAEVHRLILDLRPAVLDDLGLESAIEWCADRTLRAKGVAVRCEFSGLGARLPWELETAVFRAAQEALNNVARHSGAEAVLVQAQVHGGRLTLEVEDDGRGFDPAAVPPPRGTGRGLGLMGMRERVEVFGGTLAVDSAPGQGTHVRFEVPLPEESRDG